MTPLRVGFIGAGRRARAAHYPSVAQLQADGEVELVGICDLNEERLAAAADRYGVGPEGRYTDFKRMLREARLDAVYTIFPPTLTGPLVLEILEAGLHVFMEKPPGISVGETQRLVEAAERSGRWAMVGLQRRFTNVVDEALRRIAERGPLTMCLVEFHKDMVTRPEQRRRPTTSTLVDDLIHVVDLCRYVCGGRPDETAEVHVLHDALGGSEWPNCYNAVVRFASGAHGVISGNRSSGGRVMRVELHGNGIGCYIDPLPDRLRILADNGRTDTTTTGAALAGTEHEAEYEGTLAAHRHFVACIRERRQPLTDVRDVIGTMRLVAQLESPFWEEYTPD
jgi:virulence factor